MAQRVFFNWQENLKSFDTLQAFSGVLFPGRYCGFDTKSYTGLALSLTHASSGIIQSDINGTLTAKTGSWVSPQGSVIQESATVSIGNVTANSSGNPRIDLIVGQYLKPPTSSASATYLIVAGTPAATPVAPALPNTHMNVILGYLLVPNGTTVDLASCTFTPANIPLLGNETRPTYSVTTEVNMSNDWAADDLSSSSIVINVFKKGVATNQMSFEKHIRNSVSSSQVVMTLPVGHRPAFDIYIPVLSDRITSPGTYTASFLKITSAGVVTVINPAHASDCRVYTKGIVISLD